MGDTIATEAETPQAGDCYCSWLDEEEKQRRAERAARVVEVRAEAVRLLRLAEARAASEPSLLVHIAMAWKDLAHLH